MTDRTPAINEVREILSDYRRIWDFSDYKAELGHSQRWMQIDAYATRMGVVILHRYHTGGTLDGWDIYIPLVASNNAKITIEALKRFLAGKD
jgi:hypothetical protein